MEAGGKNRPPMLAPAPSATTDTPGIDGTLEMATYVTVPEDIKKHIDVEAKAVQIILTGIGESINVQYLKTNLYWEIGKFTSRDGETLYSYYSRNKGKGIANTPSPRYDSEPEAVSYEEANPRDKEIEKLMALILMSFKKIYKPVNNNLKISSNTKNKNVDNTPRSDRRTGYDRQSRQYENQWAVNVVGAKENVARECKKAKRVRDLAYHKEKMLLCKQKEAKIRLSTEQVDWRDDTDDEAEDQELEAHYMYMAKIQEVISEDANNSGPIFDTEPLAKVYNNNNDYNVFSMVKEYPEQSESVNDTYLVEQGDTNTTLDSLNMSNNGGEADQDEQKFQEERDLLASLTEQMKLEIDESNKINKSLESSKKALRERNTFLNSKLRELQKTQFSNEIDRLSMEYYYADNMNVILGVYNNLDEYSEMACNYLEALEKCERLENELSNELKMSKTNRLMSCQKRFSKLEKHCISLELYLKQIQEKIKNDKLWKKHDTPLGSDLNNKTFEINDLKAQLQDKNIAISELKILIEKIKRKSVETKFKKPSVVRQPNAFKFQKPSVLGKPIPFSNSLEKKDFSKSRSVPTTYLKKDLSKPITTQILPEKRDTSSKEHKRDCTRNV
ncbi:hypothetical protein Tco_1538312 [Tanacetum coccineum]